MRTEHTVNPEMFSNFVPLNALPAESRTALARKSSLWTLDPGEALFKAGDPLAVALFLKSGELRFSDEARHASTRLDAADTAAQHPLAHHSPRRVSAFCVGRVCCLAVDAGLLDVLLTWDQAAGACEVGEISAEQEIASDQWMAKLLQLGAFRRLPPSNLQAMFLRLQKMKVTAGQIVISQGDPGDYFYVIAEGRCTVRREQPVRAPLTLAEFAPGACFGEEALLSEESRNATVVMLTDGVLMRLSKADFRNLLKEPLARLIGFETASARIGEASAQWLDVRLPDEYQNRHLDGSQNLPLFLLRKKLPSLSRAITYICVCDTGSRSSVAHFLLTQQGFDAWVLAGGLPARI